VQPVQAQVIGAALEGGELGAAAQQRMQCLDRTRQIPLDELALQRQRRGGDHHAAAVLQRGHEIAERLSGAGARLHQQMGALVDGLGHRF
jgi:hypothetical protein